MRVDRGCLCEGVLLVIVKAWNLVFPVILSSEAEKFLELSRLSKPYSARCNFDSKILGARNFFFPLLG